jgi:hypothetical protein
MLFRRSIIFSVFLSFYGQTPPEGQFIPVCTQYYIQVNVQNPGTQSATNVCATVALVEKQDADQCGGAELVDGARQQCIPSLTPGGSWNPYWVWHCTGVGPVEFQVIVAATGMEDQYVYRGFYQGKPHLRVTITEPRNGIVYTPCTHFPVTATVTNTGQLGAVATTCTLGINGPASLVNDVETKAVGVECADFVDAHDLIDAQMYPYLCIPPGESYEVSWNLHCDGEGNVVLTARPDGYMYPPGYVPDGAGIDGPYPVRIYADNLEEGRITVYQREPQQGGGETPVSPCADIPGCPVCFTPDVNLLPRLPRAGQPVTITVTALNNCATVNKFNIPLTINGKVEQTKTVEISPHGSYQVQFTVVKNEPGTYTVNFDNYKASFVVEGNVSTGSTAGSNAVIPLIAFSLLAVIVVALVLLVRRRPA